MIKARDAIQTAMGMVGTPYSELDCINFIKAVIRRAPGGDPKYTDAHVPALWASYDSSPKYRHLTQRRENIRDLRPGELVFKGRPLGRDGEPEHVGMYIGDGQVIHSSSAKKCVVVTDVNNGQWTLAGTSAYIEPGGDDDVQPDPGPDPAGDYLYLAEVYTKQGGKTVNLRAGPSTSDPVIRRVNAGTTVAVRIELGGWDFVQAGTDSGYMSADYLRKIPDSEPTPAPDPEPVLPEWLEDVTLQSEAGGIIHLSGRWRIVED